jgi:hypothetical protein
MPKAEKATGPMLNQSKQFVGLFDYFNQNLFGGSLNSNRVMLLFTRNKAVIGGYFSPDRWENEDGDLLHEIALNANGIEGNMLNAFLFLIHEMCHLEQHEAGKASRPGYHNAEFVKRLKAMDITSLNMDKDPENPEKDKPGQRLSAELIEGGVAAEVIRAMPEDLLFDWSAHSLQVDPPDKEKGGDGTGEGEKQRSRNGVRHKYTCAVCGLNAWSKPGVRLICGDDMNEMIEQVKGNMD